MSEHEVDVVVIGLGPGGEDAAGRLAEAGLRVAGVEARLVGGECPYWGCVPSKMMIRAADLLAEGRRIPGHGRRRRPCGPTGRRSRAGSGPRPPTTGTTRWPPTGSPARAALLFRGHGTIIGAGPGGGRGRRAAGPSAGS